MFTDDDDDDGFVWLRRCLVSRDMSTWGRLVVQEFQLLLFFSQHPVSAWTYYASRITSPTVKLHYSNMSLCQYCNNIPAKLFSFRRDDQCSHDHQPNLSTLKESAAGGCQGCSLFLHAVESSTSEHAQGYALDRNWNENEQMRLSSTKFGWQEINFAWRKAGVFRTFAVPSEWGMSLLSPSPPHFTHRY